MLQKLTFVADPLPPLELLIGDTGSSSNPIQIRNLEGLGPVGAELAMLPHNVVPGEAYLGGTVPSRNIVLTVGLNPDWEDQTVTSLRQLLYRHLMPLTQTLIKFESTHLPTVEILGVVETLEPVIFSKDPEVQISVLCPSPDFVSIVPITISGDIGTMALPAPQIVDYAGSAPAGGLLTLRHVAPNPTYNGWVDFEIERAGIIEDMGFSMVLSSTVYYEMSTVPLHKSLYQVTISSGVRANRFRNIVDGSKWPLLRPGVNTLQVVTDVAQNEWDFVYFERFGGL